MSTTSRPRPLALAQILLAIGGASAAVTTDARAQVRTAPQAHAPPEHVRIWTTDRALRGTKLALVRMGGDTLVLGPAKGLRVRSEREADIRQVALRDVVRLDVPGPQRDRITGTGRGALRGSLVGAGAGTVVGLATATQGGYALLVLFFAPPAGFVGGAAVGGLAGLAAPGRAWVRAYDAGSDTTEMVLAQAVLEGRVAAASIVRARQTPLMTDRVTGAMRPRRHVRARITVPSWRWSRREVRVDSMTSDTLYYALLYPGRVEGSAVAADSITRMEVFTSHGSRHDAAGRGALGGLVFGAVAGGAYNAVVDASGGSQRSREWREGSAVGGAVGFVSGALLGAMLHSGRWMDVPRDQRSSPDPRRAPGG